MQRLKDIPIKGHSHSIQHRKNKLNLVKQQPDCAQSDLRNSKTVEKVDSLATLAYPKLSKRQFY